MASHLLNLSTELTLEVMKYLFGYMHTIHISHGADTEYTMGSILEDDEDDEPEIQSLNPQILRVCSQLRTSGMSVLYGFHTFEFMSIDSLRWFVSRTDTSQIRHLRFLLDEEISDTIAWISFWKSSAFRNGFSRLRSVEIDSPYAPMTKERKFWYDSRLDIACEKLEELVPEGCKVVKKYP